MQKIKKLSIYDVNPRYFKDNTGNGNGDLIGLAQKFDYFDYLGVDAVILQDIIASHSENLEQNFKSIDKKVGDINGLTLVLSHAKRLGIKIFLEMKIGTIRETHNWFPTAVDTVNERGENLIEFSNKKELLGTESSKYNNEAKAYFPIDDRTKEIPLNWKSDKVIENFVDVIKFWNDLGISGFVFKDFEYITDKTKTESMTEETLKELRKFYTAIKEINDDIVVIGKTQDIPLNHAERFTEGATKVFDYVQSTRISMIGTYNKYGADAIGKFATKKLARRLHIFANNPANIVSFGSENIGRFVSRWGDDGQYNKESAKAFAMLNMLTPASSTTYYADELGAKNIGLTHLDDFQDKDLELRKRDMLDMKITEKEFMDAQVLQNPINARSLMMWNSKKNGGFSVSEKTVTPPSAGYSENNVEIQFADEKSVLNFYKGLNKLIKTSVYGKVIKKGTWKLTSLAAISGVIKMTSRLDNKEVIVLVNVTDSERKIIGKFKEGKVVLSTYADKEYKELPKKLQPFEGVLISKNTDEYIKETQFIKVQKSKAAIAAKKEADAIKAAEAKAAEKAKQEAIRAEAEKTRLLEIKQAEKIQKREEAKAERLQLKEQAAKEAEAEKTRLLEVKQAEKDAIEKEKRRAENQKLKEEALAMREKENAKRKAEKEEARKQAELAKEKAAEEKAKAKSDKYNEKTRMIEIKNAAKAEKNAAKEAEKRSSVNEKINPDEITTLTEDDIAATTQIDVDDIEDIEEFLNNSK